MAHSAPLQTKHFPKSDALRANLLETAVERVTIAPHQEMLRTVVNRDVGILKALDRLLLELNHPFRNWLLILPELRSFVLGNANRYVHHPTGPECFGQFVELFFSAVTEAGKEDLIQSALDGLTSTLDKWASLQVATRMPTAPFLDSYWPVYNQIFDRLAKLPKGHLLLLSQSHHPIKRTVAILLKQVDTKGKSGLNVGSVFNLAFQALDVAYDYWLSQLDPLNFAPDIQALHTISHTAIHHAISELQEIKKSPPDPNLLPRLLALPTFLDIVRGYRLAADQLGRLGVSEGLTDDAERLAESRKLRFMFHIMEIAGLGLIHEETLREINRSLVHLVRLKQSFEAIEESLLKTFEFLNAKVVNYPHTALQCIEVLGREVFERNNNLLVEAFLEQVVRFGFQYRFVKGIGEDWQPISNPAHLFNIRVWLNLIILNPKWCSTLLSALIINLKLTGTLIRDTDLFQKEVTRLLNSNVKLVYNLVKQFTRQLPVYFNEIGAEGELRDVSTLLDETTHRHDRLIHFLRKQCHVESTNLIVDLVRAILQYWRSGNLTVLESYVALPVLVEVRESEAKLLHVQRVINALFDTLQIEQEEQLLDISIERVRAIAMAHTQAPESERLRVVLLVRLYQLVTQKYNLGCYQSILPILQHAIANGFAGLQPLLTLLEQEKDPFSRLRALLDGLEFLKSIILSDQIYPAHEEIFQKRHVAANIPSVYGHYQEMKFDALSLSFRLENLARIQLEAIASRIPDGFITQAAFFKVVKYLKLFLTALDLDGVASRKIKNLQTVLERSLELNPFSFHQYLDIFRGFSQGVRDIISTYYSSHHRDNLAIIVPMIPKGALLPKYEALRTNDFGVFQERIGEVFLRDLIAETFGLQAFDVFISRLFQTLSRQEGQLAPHLLDQLMTYDPAKLFCSIQKADKLTKNLVHLGNKGFNLVQLVENGLPVPPGVILTTEYFRCQEVIKTHPPSRQDFLDQLKYNILELEKQTGQEFGCPENPLLLSVRSGALISMPGMMQTIHNVGINEEIVKGLVQRSGNTYFAWDNYRRFIQSWSMTFQVGRGTFNDLMRLAKRRYDVRKKREFTSNQMAYVAMDYKWKAIELGIKIPEDPWKQLEAAIDQVILSWHATKASEYRRLLKISHEWGTAVVLQQMVFGNIHAASGSGVLFTAHPHRKLDRVLLWGDYTAGNQGEDIVSGLVSTNPISLEQCQYDGRDPDKSLESCFPDVYAALLASSHHLVYDLGWNPQEIEFTYDGPETDNLFLLQSRDMSMYDDNGQEGRMFRQTPELSLAHLAHGIGVSGGALSGIAVFNLEQILSAREKFPKTPLILIRYDTVPDDITEISLTDGLLTSRGGQTSHAAIVAARLHKICVVGCEDLLVREKSCICEVGEHIIRFGDAISIEGRHGQLFKGWHPLESHASVEKSSIEVDKKL
ncbi:MAG: PEP-utilizing enzyme [Magnetococcus sp. DMHC-6]